jgi:hypothetical protein
MESSGSNRPRASLAVKALLSLFRANSSGSLSPPSLGPWTRRIASRAFLGEVWGEDDPAAPPSQPPHPSLSRSLSDAIDLYLHVVMRSPECRATVLNGLAFSSPRNLLRCLWHRVMDLGSITDI